MILTDKSCFSPIGRKQFHWTSISYRSLCNTKYQTIPCLTKLNGCYLFTNYSFTLLCPHPSESTQSRTGCCFHKPSPKVPKESLNPIISTLSETFHSLHSLGFPSLQWMINPISSTIVILPVDFGVRAMTRVGHKALMKSRTIQFPGYLRNPKIRNSGQKQ